jgi:predicted HTH domain antitoxin
MTGSLDLERRKGDVWGHIILTILKKNNTIAGIMVQITIEVNEGVLATRHSSPERFAKDLRLAAAVKWYENGEVSQGRAAEIAGISRAEFISALSQFGVSPFQYDADEILEEVNNGL